MSKRLFKVKQIEISKGNRAVVIDWRYVKHKRKDILASALKTAEHLDYYDSVKRKTEFFIIETETEAGRLNLTYPSDEKFHCIELSRRSITEEELKKLFTL